MDVLQQRSDFLKCAQARRQAGGSLLLQGRAREDGSDTIRIGFTASKKVGNAVARNRAKRRLRELARDVLISQGQQGWDYVIVARPNATIVRDFLDMRRDLVSALHRLHGAKP